MKKIAFIFIAVLLLLAAVFSLLQLRALWAYEYSSQQMRALGVLRAANSNEPSPSETNSLTSKMQLQTDLGEQLRAVSKIVLAAGSSHELLAEYLRKLAETQEDLAQKIQYLCEALSEVGQALKNDSTNSRLLTNWANIRQVLGSTHCSQPYSEGVDGLGFAGAIEKALIDAPADANVKYASALIFSWAGDRSRALKLFRDVLTLSVGLDYSQQNFIFSQMLDAAALREGLPARFPQILIFAKWYQRIGKKGLFDATGDNPDLRRAQLEDAFADMQIEALKQSLSDYENGKISQAMHLARVSSIGAFVEKEKARRVVDSQLADLYRSQQLAELADYYRRRSALELMPVNIAVIHRDSRTLKTPLANWGLNESFYFDEAFNSIGFYLAAEDAPKLIQLRAKGKSPKLSNSQVKLFVSEDNLSWKDVTDITTIEKFDENDNSVLILKPDCGYHRYWKINYAASSRERSFANDSQEMLAAYGNKN